MLIINNDDVGQLLTMQECIEAQERAFAKLPAGGAIRRPRIDMYFPGPDDGYSGEARRRAPTTATSPSA